jgi:L-asparaginase II
LTFAPPVLAEVVRSGFVESRHRGHVAVVEPDGAVSLTLGDPGQPFFPRSSNKPLQAVAMVDLGLDVPADLLAVSCGSHAGLPMHVDAVQRLLASAGLSAADLDNTPDLPIDTDATRRLLAAGGGPDRLHQNCSGNHAAMLATCVVRRWPTTGYLDPEHPLQVAIRERYSAMSGTSMSAAAVDGCGAPLYAFSLVGLARAYAGLVSSTAPTAAARVAAAMRAHPELVGGPGRPASGLMAACPGLIAKGGAEGVFAIALPDGRALAIKIEDGAARACAPVAVSVLRQLGVANEELDRWATVPVYGHGDVVGDVRAVGVGPLSD